MNPYFASLPSVSLFLLPNTFFLPFYPFFLLAFFLLSVLIFGCIAGFCRLFFLRLLLNWAINQSSRYGTVGPGGWGRARYFGWFFPNFPFWQRISEKIPQKRRTKKKKNDTRPQCSSSCLLFLFSLSALPKKNTPFLWKKKYPFGHAPRTGPPRFCSFLGHWCGFFCLVLVMFFFWRFRSYLSVRLGAWREQRRPLIGRLAAGDLNAPTVSLLSFPLVCMFALLLCAPIEFFCDVLIALDVPPRNHLDGHWLRPPLPLYRVLPSST